MRFLAVEGVTGKEAKIAEAVSDDLKKVGVPASAIRFDDANKRIPLPTETGNLIVDLPGTAPGPRLLFSTHLDTVPLCAGAKPRREGDRIVSDGTTALGGDNRTGCAVLVVAGRDAAQAQASPSADHAALHRARGERAARRARAGPEGARRRGDVHQRRWPEARRPDHRRRRPGELGGRDHRQGVPCRRRPGEGHLGHAGRRARPRRGAPGGLVRQGREARRHGHEQHRHLRRQGRQRRRRRHQRRHRLCLPQGRGAQPRRGLRRRRSPTAIAPPSPRRKAEVKDDEGETAKVKFTQDDRLSAVPARRDVAGRAARGQARSQALGHRAQPRVLQRRARRQLARQARRPDRDHRRRPGRDPHHQGIRQPAGVRDGLPARRCCLRRSRRDPSIARSTAPDPRRAGRHSRNRSVRPARWRPTECSARDPDRLYRRDHRDRRRPVRLEQACRSSSSRSSPRWRCGRPAS